MSLACCCCDLGLIPSVFMWQDHGCPPNTDGFLYVLQFPPANKTTRSQTFFKMWTGQSASSQVKTDLGIYSSSKNKHLLHSKLFCYPISASHLDWSADILSRLTQLVENTNFTAFFHMQFSYQQTKMLSLH